MKTSLFIATSSLQAVQAVQASGSIVNDGCEAIKWNGEKIPFKDSYHFTTINRAFISILYGS